jgi:hypothetical protein
VVPGPGVQEDFGGPERSDCQPHAVFDELAADLRGRTGRSILHELSDAELAKLVGFIGERPAVGGPAIERDRWTLWWASA